ncbi:MAG: hypothetical protein AAGB31_01205 [Bdellovibrio sp.]
MKLFFRHLKQSALLLSSFILVVAFQNCGKAGFDSASSDDTETVTDADGDEVSSDLVLKYGSSKALLVHNIPFAFTTTFDTISYNSCADSKLSGQTAYYSLKAGAYSNSGVSLNSDFFDYMNTNFKPVYPETALSSLVLKEYLDDSPQNAGAIATMAIRKPASLAVVYTQNSSVTLESDVISMVDSLTDPLISESFITQGTTARYFPFSSQSKTVEAVMRFNTSEALQDEYREYLSASAAVLTLSYLPQTYTTAAELRSASTVTSPSVAYGRGYKLSFAPAVPTSGATPYSSNPNNSLDSVIEYDLSGAVSTKTTWDCSRKYKVVLAEDAATTTSGGYCPRHTWSELSNASIRSEMEIVRRVLPANQWEVNVSYGCVYPTGSVSCYDEEKILNTETTSDTTDYYPIVEYDLTQPCFRENGNNAEPSRCLQYVTICTRP